MAAFFYTISVFREMKRTEEKKKQFNFIAR